MDHHFVFPSPHGCHQFAEMLHWMSQFEEEAGMSQPQSHAEVTRGFEAKRPAVGRPLLSRALRREVLTHAVLPPRRAHIPTALSAAQKDQTGAKTGLGWRKMAKSSLTDLMSLRHGSEAASGWAGLLAGTGTPPTASVRVCQGAGGAGGAA